MHLPTEDIQKKVKLLFFIAVSYRQAQAEKGRDM